MPAINDSWNDSIFLALAALSAEVSKTLIAASVARRH